MLRGRWQTLWMSNRCWPLLLDFLWRSLLALRGRSYTLLSRRHLPLWRRSGTFRGSLLLWMLHGSRFLLLRRLRCLPLRSRLRVLLRHLPLRRGNSALLGRLRLRRWLRSHRLLYSRRMLLLLRRRLRIRARLARPRDGLRCGLVHSGLWLSCWLWRGLRTHRLLHRRRMLLLLRHPLLLRSRLRSLLRSLLRRRRLGSHRLLHRRRMLLLLGRGLLLMRHRLRVHAWLTWPRHGLRRRLVRPRLGLNRWLWSRLSGTGRIRSRHGLSIRDRSHRHRRGWTDIVIGWKRLRNRDSLRPSVIHCHEVRPVRLGRLHLLHLRSHRRIMLFV